MMKRFCNVCLLVASTLFIFGGDAYAQRQRQNVIVFGSNEYVVFAVEMQGRRITGGFHRNDYTGRSWQIIGGQRIGNQLKVHFIDNSTDGCDRNKWDIFVLESDRVRFTRSTDICGNVGYPNGSFGYM